MESEDRLKEILDLYLSIFGGDIGFRMLDLGRAAENAKILLEAIQNDAPLDDLDFLRRTLEADELS